MLSLLWLGFFLGQYLCFKYCGSFNILNILFDLFFVVIIIFNMFFCFVLSIIFPLTHVVSCHITPRIQQKES